MENINKRAYEKLGSRVQFLKDKRNESLEKYKILLNQLEKTQENILIAAKELSNHETKYTKAYLQYSKMHRNVLESSLNTNTKL